MLRLLNLPPIPDVPEPIRGKKLLRNRGRLHRQQGGG